jgi:hypothetical protein
VAVFSAHDGPAANHAGRLTEFLSKEDLYSPPGSNGIRVRIVVHDDQEPIEIIQFGQQTV